MVHGAVFVLGVIFTTECCSTLLYHFLQPDTRCNYLLFQEREKGVIRTCSDSRWTVLSAPLECEATKRSMTANFLDANIQG